MKANANPLAVTGAIPVGAAGPADAPKPGSMPCCGGMPSTGQDAPSRVVATSVQGIQRATVVIDDGYSPAVIEVKQGKPVELTFTGGKNLGCGGTVVFELLKIRKQVTSGASVLVAFTPAEKGEIPFTCGMGMLKGKVVVS